MTGGITEASSISVNEALGYIRLNLSLIMKHIAYLGIEKIEVKEQVGKEGGRKYKDKRKREIRKKVSKEKGRKGGQ